ncbi:hypothetical protein ACOME3_009216 [Neoechinorhynchus agilis]
MNKNDGYDLSRPCSSLAAFSRDCLDAGSIVIPTRLDGNYLAQQVVAPDLSKRQLIRERRHQRILTKGPEWFGMKAVTDVSEETRAELEILRFGRAINPKKFYKKHDSEDIPKFFQIGRIVGKPRTLETTRQARKPLRPFLEELKEDEKQMKYVRKRYAEHKERVKLKNDAQRRANRWFNKAKKGKKGK